MPVCASCGQENPDGARFCNACGTALEAVAPRREQRKTVTVLFCDVTGSTALGDSTDPEALRALLGRYFERMKSIVESHGGTVEKFIGDAVMAVFGVPQLHEDDALRACRAAVEMRAALPELGVQARIGVNTGEVVSGTEESLATGDAVNVAARLEQAAQPGEILIGGPTLELVRDAVEAEPIEALDLKGKPDPVAAYRLLAVVGELARRHDAPMVGRETELRRLRDAHEQAVRDRSCQLFTVLGSAGVGKSRIAYEFLDRTSSRIVRGRCLSYGEGITYWPVVEVLTQLGVRPEDQAAAAALRSVLGESEETTTPDEIAWAFRKTLEQAAAVAPLVCVFDDLHWAEPALLDLIEHVADWSRDAPILLLCVARAELLDRRPGWAGGKLNATTVLLEPLSGAETEELIGELAGPVGEELRSRIREAAEGNPLFVEEMLAMVRESTAGDVLVPPTIQALLAARLDQLESAERALLERGAVEGKIFHRGAVQALAPDEAEVPRRLMGLVRKELVRPDRTVLPGDDAFRFRHLLIRDAAYEGLPKSTRAELHERFALWLDERGPDLIELDEVVGYHLEQACRYQAELGLPEDEGLLAAARARLTAAGRRALIRSDSDAAVNLLERALALLPAGTISLELEFDLQDALFPAGRIDEARARARDLAERGAAGDDRIAELSGRLYDEVMRLNFEPEGGVGRLTDAITEASPVFEEAGHDPALYVLNFARAGVGHFLARFGDEVEAVDRAIEHARRAGQRQWEFGLLPPAGASRMFGPTPVPEVLAWIDEQEGRGFRHASLETHRATSLTMLGRFDEAREIVHSLLAQARERGSMVPLALTLSQGLPNLEMAAQDPGAAVVAGEEGCALLEQMGEKSWLSTGIARLAEAYFALGRTEDAEDAARRAAAMGARDDAITQMVARQVLAKVHAKRGEHEEAERLAREAVAIGEETDMLDAHGDALLDLAEVLEAAGDRPGAEGASRDALVNFERKGNVLMVERTRERLDSLLQLD